MMAAPSITINKLCTTNTYTAYNVTGFNHEIRTIVTSSSSVVTSWINRLIANQHKEVIIGLDTEGLNPIAILQLCVDDNCLIYQIIHSSSIPLALQEFLQNPKCKFSGVGVASDAKRLAKDYEVNVASIVDVSRVAADMGKVRVNAGLKEVVKAVLGWEVEKHKEVTMSQWDKELLDDGQVMYACMDAFLSYQIAKELVDFGSEDDDIEMVDHKAIQPRNILCLHPSTVIRLESTTTTTIQCAFR